MPRSGMKRLALGRGLLSSSASTLNKLPPRCGIALGRGGLLAGPPMVCRASASTACCPCTRQQVSQAPCRASRHADGHFVKESILRRMKFCA